MEGTIGENNVIRADPEVLGLQQHTQPQVIHIEQTSMQDSNGDETDPLCISLKQEPAEKATDSENPNVDHSVSPAIERTCHVTGETVEITSPSSTSATMVLTGSRPGEIPFIVPSGKAIFLSDQFTAVLIRPESLLYGMEVPVVKKDNPHGVGVAVPTCETQAAVSSTDPSAVHVPWFLQVGHPTGQQQAESGSTGSEKGLAMPMGSHEPAKEDTLTLEPLVTAPDAASATPKTPYMFTSKDRTFTCEFCPNITFTRGQLRKHKSVHTGQRNYVCGVCSKRFAVKHSLVKHMVLHAGQSPFTCEQCGKGFSTAYHLQHHARAHDPERQYKCSQCDKMFAKPDHLVVHARTHSGGETFPCSACGKSFTTKFGLNTHMRVHASAPAVYCCGLCGLQMTSYSDLVSHAKTHGEQERTALGAASECVLLVNDDRTPSQVVPNTPVSTAVATAVSTASMPMAMAMPVVTSVHQVGTA